MSPMHSIGRSYWRISAALVIASAALVGAHLALHYAATGTLAPVIVAVDVGMMAILLAIAGLYLRALARERRHRVVERLLLELLAHPRNVQAAASEALHLLAAHRIGDVAVVAVSADGGYRPLAATGYPRGWPERPTSAEGIEPPPAPRLRRVRIQPQWLAEAGAPLGRRPWIAEVPLRAGEDDIGVLLLAARKPGVLKDPVVRGLLSTGVGAALDHAALYEAAYARERDLEGLDVRRRDFMAAIAHEVRTPLTAIQAFAELLQMGQAEMDETAGHLVNSLNHGVMRLSSLVNDLIDLGRAGSTGYALRPEDIDASEVIRNAEETLRPALMLREQAVTLDLPEEGPRVHLDRRVLEQVTLNLLSNANRHSPPGGAITISARQLDGSTVRIEVSDSGPGIPEPERKRIFEPYYRAPQSISVPGSGLGLAVARRLLDESGGRIWADEGPDGGARFCLEVPAASPPLSSARRTAPPDDSPQASPPEAPAAPPAPGRQEPT